jgi:hypothetical protein
LIPLYGSAVPEVRLPPKWPRISKDEFETLQRRIADRFDRVAPLIIQQSVSGFLGSLFRFALLPGPNAVVDLIRGKVLDYIRATILADLVRRDQIGGWDLPDVTEDPSNPTASKVAPDYVRLVLAELLNPKFAVRSACRGLRVHTDGGDARHSFDAARRPIGPGAIQGSERQAL